MTLQSRYFFKSTLRKYITSKHFLAIEEIARANISEGKYPVIC